jgi:hypothetical protein
MFQARLVDIWDALYLPDHESMSREEDLPVVKVENENQDILLKAIMTLRPPLLVVDVRSWFEHYTMQALRIVSLIAHGESAFVVMGLMESCFSLIPSFDPKLRIHKQRIFLRFTQNFNQQPVKVIW